MKQPSYFYGVTFPRPVRRIAFTAVQVALLVSCSLALGFLSCLVLFWIF
jgi:hypothetical protein